MDSPRRSLASLEKRGTGQSSPSSEITQMSTLSAFNGIFGYQPKTLLSTTFDLKICLNTAHLNQFQGESYQESACDITLGVVIIGTTGGWTRAVPVMGLNGDRLCGGWVARQVD